MFSAQNIAEGLEWIFRHTRITVVLKGAYIDITIHPDYPVQKQRVRLEFRVASDSIYVNDLTGNGYASGLQGAGYGTLAFNVGVQVLHDYFGVVLGDAAARQITIRGKISAVGDPTETEKRKICRDRRAAFWQKKGFNIREPESFFTSMSATLADMKLKTEGYTSNGTPVWVDLGAFWSSSCKPLLNPNDVNVLLKLELKAATQNLNDLRSSMDVARAAADEWTGSFIGIAFIALSAVNSQILFSLTPSKIALVTLPFACWGSFYLASRAETKIRPLIPQYRLYWSTNNAHSDVRDAAKKLIEQLEVRQGGFIWRLHEGLACVDENFNCERAIQLAEASRRGDDSALLTYFDDYVCYLQRAKYIASKIHCPCAKTSTE